MYASRLVDAFSQRNNVTYLSSEEVRGWGGKAGVEPRRVSPELLERDAVGVVRVRDRRAQLAVEPARFVRATTGSAGCGKL